MGVGFFFVVAIVGVGLVILWSMQNDKLPPGARTTGVLAMKHPDLDDDDRTPTVAPPGAPPPASPTDPQGD